MQSILFVVGLMTIAATTLLYSTEEKRLQSRLEDLWLHAAELRPVSETRLVAIVAAAATAVLRLIDRLFDPKLRSVWTVASALITSTYSLIFVWRIVWDGWQLITDLSILAECTIEAIMTAAALWYRPVRIPVALIVVVFTLGLSQTSTPERDAMVAIYVGVATDIGALWLIRTLLRRFLATKTFRGAERLLLEQVLIIVIAVGPLTFPFWERHNSDGSLWPTIVRIAWWWSLTNTFVILAASALIAVLLLMIVHRIVWPLLERILYNVARLGMFEHRGRVIGAGIGLICASSPVMAKLIGALRKLVGL